MRSCSTSEKDPLSRRQEYWHRNLTTLTGALHRAGVPILAGTDAAPGVFVVPGFSLHDELAEMVAAGLTPMEALQTATSNPARFWSRTDIGRVAPNTLADLVLLAKDPTADIHNTTTIRAVVAAGKLDARAARAGLLHGVETAPLRLRGRPRRKRPLANNREDAEYPTPTPRSSCSSSHSTSVPRALSRPCSTSVPTASAACSPPLS